VLTGPGVRVRVNTVVKKVLKKTGQEDGAFGGCDGPSDKSKASVDTLCARRID
jgi:hypothetical protein